MEIVKKRQKKWIDKLKVQKENYCELLNQNRYNIKVEAVTTAKF